MFAGWVIRLSRARYVALALILAAIIVLPMLYVPTQAQEDFSWIAKAKKITWKRVKLEDVPRKVPSEIDVYLFGVKPTLVKEFGPDVEIYAAPSGSVDLVFNPAPVMIVETKGKLSKEEFAKKLGIPAFAIEYVEYDENRSVTKAELCVAPETLPSDVKVVADYTAKGGYINPFCIKKIRYAMYYLVDRDWIIKQIYLGYAIPWIAAYSPADPTYTEVADIVAKFAALVKYDPEKANKIVTDVLTALGAKKGSDGIWRYRGQKITIKFIIRKEDERKDIGLNFASELKKLGFEVQEIVTTFDVAIDKVYYTNPVDFEWHIYTEGWGRGILERWDPWQIAWFAAPWLGNMPGWGDPSYWNYRNETIDELTKAPCLGKVESKEEWIEDIRKATELSIEEAIRVYIAIRMEIYPASKDLKGVTLDLGSGLRAIVYNARNWYVPGSDVVRVGHLWAWTARSIWNIFGGFRDVYSVDPERATYDPWIWRHPFTGEPIGIRVSFTVETAGPEGKLDVPPDALKWDPEKGWVKVGEGVKATSKVVFDLSKFLGTEWHHGVTITWADVLGVWALYFDLAYNKTKAELESDIASVLKDSLSPIVAIRPLFDEKKLEVYLNYWHFDKAYIADYAVVSSVVNPFEMAFVQQYITIDKGKFALGSTRAKKEKIEQLSLVLPGHVDAIKEALEELKDKYNLIAKFVTVPGKGALMTGDEWKARLNAAIKWIDTYHLAWISNGPFMLVKFDKDAQYLELQRFESKKYPLKNTDLYYGIPKLTKIEDIVMPAKISPGADAKITLKISGEFPIDVTLMVIDPETGQVVITLKKTVEKSPVDIVIPGSETKKLKELYTYQLVVVAASEKIPLVDQASKALSTAFAAKPSPTTTTTKTTASPSPSPTTTTPATTPTTTPISTPTTTTTAAGGAAPTYLYIGIAIAVIVIIIAVALLLRKK